MAEVLAFADVLRQAGAVMTEREGRPVPAHYGSAAGELAVCIAGVGLADRSDLAILSITAAPRGLDRLLDRVLNHSIERHGAAYGSGVWWCRSSSGSEVVVICPYTRAERLKTTLRQVVNRLPQGCLVDCSESRFVLNVIGRQADRVLADLGIYGPAHDPHDATPFTEVPVLGHRVSWLLEASTSALAIVETESAGEIWRGVKAAGRPYGISCVGLESITRYILSERTIRGTASLV